jgi:CRISPR/Cas system-associated endoribonuclease Cas2
MNKSVLALIVAGSSLLAPSGYAFWGVGDIVSDPVAEEALHQKNIFDQLKYAWEQAQWAENLATLHNTLVTIREILQIAIMVKNAIGDPSQIVGPLDEVLLDGMLSDSGILDTLQERGGLVQEGGEISHQLQFLLGTPINLDGLKNAARAGSFNSFTYNADPLARYRAVEFTYQRYNSQLQSSVYRAQYLRGQIRRLQTRLGSASTDAEVQKIQGSLITADAALQDIATSIQLSADQINIARTLAVNRQDQEREACRATVDQMNQEVEANLELPVDEISTVTPNF